MTAEQILEKHLLSMLGRTDESYVSVDEMKQQPEWQAVINAMLEYGEMQALRTHGVVVELPKVNSKDFKDWLKSQGYKNKGFGIYQKENKDYCYKLLYKHYCNILKFGNSTATLNK